MSSGQRQIKAWDQQRGAPVRIKTEMWVRVIGRDSEPVRRTGDICASGFFFEVEAWMGRPGDIGVMEVSSEDLAHSFTSMASLVRIVGEEEARFGSTRPGASYQFLPSDEATRTSIARTVRHIAEQHPEQSGELVLEEFQQAAAEGMYPGAAESARPTIEAGGRVSLVVESPTGGGKREVEGIVGDITESVQADGATRFWVPVYLVEDGAGDEADCSAQRAAAQDAGPAPHADDSLIERMWHDLVPEARSILDESGSDSSPASRSHLSGRLSQISMPSTLWLLDQERLSGALEFRRDGEQVTLFVLEGRVIDAESPHSDRDPRAHLAALMSWKEGDFEFHVQAVDRPDRIGVPTQGLLLDLAVAADEDGR